VTSRPGMTRFTITLAQLADTTPKEMSEPSHPRPVRT
jgi:hypothetical protein